MIVVVPWSDWQTVVGRCRYRTSVIEKALPSESRIANGPVLRSGPAKDFISVDDGGPEHGVGVVGGANCEPDAEPLRGTGRCSTAPSGGRSSRKTSSRQAPCGDAVAAVNTSHVGRTTLDDRVGEVLPRLLDVAKVISDDVAYTLQ